MHLHRVTPDPFQSNNLSEHNVGQAQDSLSGGREFVVAKFDRFGNGARRSDFELTIYWEDVARLISMFSESKNLAAQELQSALLLAKALKEAGWHLPEKSN